MRRVRKSFWCKIPKVINGSDRSPLNFKSAQFSFYICGRWLGSLYGQNSKFSQDPLECHLSVQWALTVGLMNHPRSLLRMLAGFLFVAMELREATQLQVLTKTPGAECNCSCTPKNLPGCAVLVPFLKTLRWWSWIWFSCVLSFLSCMRWYCWCFILFQGKPCDYPSLENGRLSDARYYFPKRFGQTVDYYCLNGYSTPTGAFWVRATCSETGWFPEPKCLSKYISTICSILL